MNNIDPNLPFVPQRMQIELLQRQQRDQERRLQRQTQLDLNMIGIGQHGSEGVWKVWLTDILNTPSKLVFEIYDLLYIIITYADDESLFKLAYVN